jgi:hypothetical protein
MTEDDKALVEELREDGYNGHNPLCLKAADHIEALAAEIKRLKNILRDCDPESMSWLDARDAALGETQ